MDNQNQTAMGMKLEKFLKENPEVWKFFDNHPEILKKMMDSYRQKLKMSVENDYSKLDESLDQDTKLMEEASKLAE